MYKNKVYYPRGKIKPLLADAFGARYVDTNMDSGAGDHVGRGAGIGGCFGRGGGSEDGTGSGYGLFRLFPHFERGRGGDGAGNNDGTGEG